MQAFIPFVSERPIIRNSYFRAYPTRGWNRYKMKSIILKLSIIYVLSLSSISPTWIYSCIMNLYNLGYTDVDVLKADAGIKHDLLPYMGWSCPIACFENIYPTIWLICIFHSTAPFSLSNIASL